MEEERLGEEVDGGGGKEVEKGKGEGRSGEEREPGGGETEEVEGQRRWRKEGVCVFLYTSRISSPSCSTPCCPTGPSACTY